MGHNIYGERGTHGRLNPKLLDRTVGRLVEEEPDEGNVNEKENAVANVVPACMNLLYDATDRATGEQMHRRC